MLGCVTLEYENVCDPCTPGKFRVKNECFDCQSGTFTGAPNSLRCSSCPAGFFNNEAGESFCLSCLPGQYQSFNSSKSCVDCPVDTYSAVSLPMSTTECQPCPQGTGTQGVANTDQSQCEGMYIGKLSVKIILHSLR